MVHSQVDVAFEAQIYNGLQIDAIYRDWTLLGIMAYRAVSAIIPSPFPCRL